MKNLLLKSILLTILLTGWSATALAEEKFTPEEVCKFVNYQSKSVDQQAEGETKPDTKFADKLAVVTEERMGNPDNKYTFACYRKIECTAPTTAAKGTGTATGSGTTTPPATTPPASGTSGTAAPTGTDKSTTPPALRKCTTTFSHECSGGMNSKQLSEAQKASAAYTICEPVMVYLSSAGTDLLYFYMGQVYRYAAGIGGLLAVLILIIAGIMWTTAGDNTNQITMARNMITKSITGLILLFLTAIILYTINPNFFVL